MKVFLAGLCLVLSGVAVFAEEDEQRPPPCAAPEYDQFDFWLGKWTSYDKDGKKQGTNHLHQVMGNCGMQENWTSANGAYKGTSFNFYDKREDKWYQTWVDNQGGHLFLEGGMAGDSMQLSGERTNPDGEHVIDRITWTPLDDGRVRQHWEVSKDGGDTWSDLFDGYYQKDSPMNE